MENNTITLIDYRNTSFSNLDFSIEDKKINFLIELKEEKPRIWNIYININKIGDKFNAKFKEIYHHKCVYCGISVYVIESSRFEIDHVIPHASIDWGKGHTRSTLNGIDNLVNSCQLCNRSKSDFYILDEYLELMHPDNNNLNKVFYRDSDYSIKIKEEYKDDSFIKEFYTSLKLHNELRRVDYLLMEMKEFCNQNNKSDELIFKLQTLILKIEQKKRFNY